MPPRLDIPERLRALLRKAYGPALAADDLVLIKHGSYGNANVYRLGEGAGARIIKEFYSRPWFIRKTFGHFLVRREARALADLDGIAGVPPGGRRLGPEVLAESFVEGETLVDLHRIRQVHLPKSFFVDLERLVAEMHRAGYAHLDLRNLGNILCGKDGRPYILDFQSCMRTAHLPRWMRTIMENTDRSGIYKCWLKLCAEPLDPERAAFVDRFSSIRKLWVFQGYWASKTWRKLTHWLRRTVSPSTNK
jgi:hypothetical protein